MTRIIFGTFIAAGVLLAQSQGQQPGANPVQGPQGGGRGAPAANARGNEQAGVDIDRFIGDPVNSPVHLSHATLLTALDFERGRIARTWSTPRFCRTTGLPLSRFPTSTSSTCRAAKAGSTMANSFGTSMRDWQS